ncbi:MAG: addiction module protein [Gemmatimonadetes bacterium]|nr:addiction module protein [Gemmatimonadota bacterium]
MSQMITDEELAAAEAESAVMQLPRERRAQIAARLLRSLDDEESRLERAWAAELRERIRAVEAGEMKLLTEEEADAEVEELLR